MASLSFYYLQLTSPISIVTHPDFKASTVGIMEDFI